MGLLKNAGENDREKASSVLERIRAEAPEHWPYGLTVDHFAPGNLWLIQKDASSDPVGFVGWQRREEAPYKVGYYSVGLVPEYRGKGIASSAISSLIEKKAYEVDKVKAMVVEGNVASERMAGRLGVELESLQKQANRFKTFAELLLRNQNKVMLGGGAVTGAGMDTWMNRGTDLPAPSRAVDGLINAAGGALAARYGSRYFGKTTPGVSRELMKGMGSVGNIANKLKGSVMSIPLTTMAVHHTRNSGRDSLTLQRGAEATEAANVLQAKANEIASGAIDATKGLANSAGEAASANPILAALLVAGGVGGAGWLINRAIKDKEPTQMDVHMKAPQQGGRLKVTLPTKNPGDSETVLDLPFEQEGAVSNAIQQRLGIDVRRRLRAEIKQRKKPRGITYDTQVA